MTQTSDRTVAGHMAVCAGCCGQFNSTVHHHNTHETGFRLMRSLRFRFTRQPDQCHMQKDRDTGLSGTHALHCLEFLQLHHHVHGVSNLPRGAAPVHCFHM